jgi:hypothetical protein
MTDSCGVGVPVEIDRDWFYTFVDSPQRRFCRITPPWSAGTQLKFHGVLPLPGDAQIAATIQNLAGPEIVASDVARNADALPTLGRNLATGRATVPLIEPATQYEGRVTQLDVRLAKIFRVRKLRVQGTLDLFNALNASPALVVNNTYGLARNSPSSNTASGWARRARRPVRGGTGPAHRTHSQKVAIGLMAEPVAPRTGSGATVRRNSHRFEAAAFAAAASGSLLSIRWMPRATIAKSWTAPGISDGLTEIG